MVKIYVDIPDELMQELKNRLNMQKSTGIQRGDQRKAIIQAIVMWLDNKINELKAENLRLLNENVCLITENSAQKNMISVLKERIT